MNGCCVLKNGARSHCRCVHIHNGQTNSFLCRRSLGWANNSHSTLLCVLCCTCTRRHAAIKVKAKGAVISRFPLEAPGGKFRWKAERMPLVFLPYKLKFLHQSKWSPEGTLCLTYKSLRREYSQSCKEVGARVKLQTIQSRINSFADPVNRPSFYHCFIGHTGMCEATGEKRWM